MVLSDEVGYLLSRVSGLVVRAANGVLREHGLRVRQYSVLSLATENPDGLSQRELADVLGLDASQVVALVDELTQAGLVERRPSTTDRRAKAVVATEAGQDARRQAKSSTEGQVLGRGVSGDLPS